MQCLLKISACLLHISISLKIVISLHLLFFEFDFAFKLVWQELCLLHGSPGTHWLFVFAETAALSVMMGVKLKD